MATTVAIVAMVASFAACAQSPSLDQLVAKDRQRALGLDTLTPEQQSGLARLLQQVYQLGVVNGSKRMSGSAGSVVESQVDGEFNGWEGETIVKLMNGQSWQQTEYYYHYHYSYMPKAIVYRSGGGYKMKIDGVDTAVGVQQLR